MRVSDVTTTATAKVLTRAFPADFPNAPRPPEEGDYVASWQIDDGIARRLLASRDYRFPDDVTR